MNSTAAPVLGLRQNAGQFWLLVLINGFVGAMIGMERSVVPLFAEAVFGIDGHTALLSFIVAFGMAKSGANLLMGQLTGRVTRKQLLLIGWIFALPVPWLLLYATSWWWVIAANLLLGIHQGLAWSATVVMKIDLVGERNRGLAMGINEFAGYVAVGLLAFGSGYLASAMNNVRYAFVPGIGFSLGGLVLTALLVRDTRGHVQTEAGQSKIPLLTNIWKDTSWRHANLGPVTFSGFVNNLNDGIMWGLLPVWLSDKGYSVEEVGFLAGLYPVIWGIGQLGTGRLGDFFCKKHLLSWGMLLQGIAIAGLSVPQVYPAVVMALIALGAGTALVYPTFLSVVAENTHPRQRPQSLGYFRFWRDLGYVVGALLAGLLGDAFGIGPVLLGTALLTAGAGGVIQIRMHCGVKSAQMAAQPE